MLGNKTIVDAFNTTWEQCVMAAACDIKTDVFPEQRILLRRVGSGEFCAVYGTSNYPTLITTRWSNKAFGAVVYAHHLFQELIRLRKYHISSRMVCENGIVSCVYTREVDKSD